MRVPKYWVYKQCRREGRRSRNPKHASSFMRKVPRRICIDFLSGLTNLPLSATGISVSVIYLDRGDNKEASAHRFPDDKEPMLHLLYRPGHYDVLYAKS